MSAQPADRRLIGDGDIRLQPMHLEGVFTIAPEIGSGGRKNKLMYHIECHYPAFAEVMGQAAKRFGERQGGTISSRFKKNVPMKFSLRFDGPPGDRAFAARFVHLAGELFMELRKAFGGWQVQDYLFEAARGTNPTGTTKPLRLVRRRRES